MPSVAIGVNQNRPRSSRPNAAAAAAAANARTPSGKPRLVTVSTTGETQLLHLPLVAVNTILDEDLDGFRSFARLTQWQLETALGALGDLMLRDPGKRLSRCCYGFPERLETPDGLGVIDIDLSQDDLALMSNVGRTKANNVLSDLQVAGQSKTAIVGSGFWRPMTKGSVIEIMRSFVRAMHARGALLLLSASSCSGLCGHENLPVKSKLAFLRFLGGRNQ